MENGNILTKAQFTDNQVRGVVLKKAYEKRREGLFQWTTEDFADSPIDFDEVDLFRACDQLGEHGLLDWEGIPSGGRTVGGVAKISTFGVDVISP